MKAGLSELGKILEVLFVAFVVDLIPSFIPGSEWVHSWAARRARRLEE